MLIKNTSPDLTLPQRFSITTPNQTPNWRIQIKQTQLVSQVTTILLQRHTKLWGPLLKSLKFSPNFTPSTFDQIIDRIQTHPKICLSFFKWAKKNFDFDPEFKTKCNLARILYGSGMSKYAKPILDSVIEDNPPEKIVPLLIRYGKVGEFHCISPVLNSVIECYCSKKMYLQSLLVYQKAIQQGIELNVNTCNVMLNLLCDKYEIRTAWCFYASMIRNRVSGDKFTSSLIAKILCKEGKLDRVSRIFDMGIYTPAMFNLMIECYSKRGDFKTAFEYLNRMFSKRVSPNLSTYASILDGACKFKDKEVIENVTCLMVEKRDLLEPFCMNYDSIIQKLCDLGKTYAVDLFFKRACDEKIELKNSTYECVFKALLSEENRVNDAIHLYNSLQENKIAINKSCYNDFVTILCRENPSESVGRLLVEIIRGGLDFSATEISNYIDKQCEKGDFRGAEELLNLILDKGYLVSSASCDFFVKFYCNRRQIDLAIMLQNKMERANGVLELDTYNLFLDALFKAKRIEEAIKIFEYMKRRNILSSESFSVMIRGLCQEKEMRKGMKLHDEMLELGLKPNGKNYKRLISGFR